jgi:hypothetical protein
MSGLEVYDVRAVLDFVPISRNKLYQELESGRLAGAKVGSKWLITGFALREWLGIEQEPLLEPPRNEEIASTEAEGVSASGCQSRAIRGLDE